MWWLAVATAHTSIDPGPPAVYWTSSPTLANQTVLVAGAGFSTAGGFQWCSGGDIDAVYQEVCVAANVSVTNQSLTAVPPVAAFADDAGAIRLVARGSSAVIVQLNEPDLWWASSSSPASVDIPPPPTPHTNSHPNWCGKQSCFKLNASSKCRA